MGCSCSAQVSKPSFARRKEFIFPNNKSKPTNHEPIPATQQKNDEGMVPFTPNVSCTQEEDVIMDVKAIRNDNDDEDADGNASSDSQLITDSDDVEDSGRSLFNMSGLSKGYDATFDAKTYNDYAVICPLGQGSFGKVKMVIHVDTLEIYALKIVRKKMKKRQEKGHHLLREVDEDNDDNDVVVGSAAKEHNPSFESFLMSRIRHPNVVHLVEAMESDEKTYLVLEYMEGGSLGQTPQLPLIQPPTHHTLLVDFDVALFRHRMIDVLHGLE
eukprot:PhF_6_TR33588/c1_g1_i3/m.49034